MAKKKNIKKDEKVIEGSVKIYSSQFHEAVVTNELITSTTENTDLPIVSITKTDDSEVSNVVEIDSMTIHDLIYYKKGTEILLTHYSNLAEMNVNYDMDEYNKSLKELNTIRKYDEKLMNRIEMLIKELK